MIHDLCFNQDYTCLSVSTPDKHRIFNCDPFGEFHVLPTSGLHADEKPTRILRMLFSTSLTILVSENENADGRVLKILNLKQNLKICELTFPSRILEVKLNRKRLVVFLELGQIYIYDLTSIRLIKVLEVEPFTVPSSSNKSDSAVIADLSSDDQSYLVIPLSMINESTDILNSEVANVVSGSPKSSPVDLDGLGGRSPNAVPGPNLDLFIEPTHKNLNSKNASVKPLATLKDLKKNAGGWILVYDTTTLKPRLIYKAHDSAIAKVAISSDSKYIATASTKGTIVRVSHIVDNESSEENVKLSITQVTNLRRGHNPVHINALAFSLDSSALGCGSESGTVHLYSLKSSHDTNNDGNVAEDDDSQDSGDEDNDTESNARLSSSEDLNENLANLLLSKQSDEIPKPKEKEHNGSYFSALKSSSKLLNNPYTKSIMKRLPYKQYLKTLIWEKPRRSFAYAKIPEIDVGHLSHKRVEIGFANSDVLMLASYNSGKLYQFQIRNEEGDEREQCDLVASNSFI